MKIITLNPFPAPAPRNTTLFARERANNDKLPCPMTMGTPPELELEFAKIGIRVPPEALLERGERMTGHTPHLHLLFRRERPYGRITDTVIAEYHGGLNAPLARIRHRRHFGP